MTLPEAIREAEDQRRRGVACESDDISRVAYVVAWGNIWQMRVHLDGTSVLVPAAPGNELLTMDCWHATDDI